MRRSRLPVKTDFSLIFYVLMFKHGKIDEAERRELLGELEIRFLDYYYCIPYAQEVSNTMFSYQCQYYTDNYNPMYELGDMRLIQFNYGDEVGRIC